MSAYSSAIGYRSVSTYGDRAGENLCVNHSYRPLFRYTVLE